MSERNIPEWVLERYILGELPDFKIKEIKTLLKEDLNLKEKLSNLEESNKKIIDKYPSGLMVGSIIKRLGQRRKTRGEEASPRKVLFKRILIASPAIVLFLIFTWLVIPLLNGPDDTTRIKGISNPHLGKPHIIIHREHLQTGVEQLKNGAIANSGDLIQLAYLAEDQLFGMIFSIDGSGVVTLHFPNSENEPTVLQTNKKIYLPNSYELDNAPHFERFFFITSKEKFDVTEVLEQAKNLAKNPVQAKTNHLKLGKDLNQFSVVLIKGD
jgi:hypothetical protein